ncbi:MAG: molybdopterin-dependent oxidoreductase [Thermodesulfobacteriota bacterium]
MVTLTIDGIQVTVPRGTMILEAAKAAGVKIPTLCNNKRLLPFGACRLCVVQQKGRRGLIPACFNPVRNGMEILTNTPEVIKARKIQLQLILISHPLDCPVCDAGGQCELQNLVYEYGVADNPFQGEKARLPVDHVSPFIERNPNRCILCGMCVRICDEVVGANELSFVNRGWKTKIGTDFDRPLQCEFCGNCISVCPVGALNDRLFLHKARVWDLRETNTVCGYCGVGCTLTIGTKDEKIKRVRADENSGINRGNLCVKGRFGWEYIHHPERLISPLIRKNGTLVKSSWEEALELVAKRFQEIKDTEGGRAIAGLASPRLTNEELYTFQKLLRGVWGTNNIDHAGGYSYAANLALQESLGFAASTNSFNQIRQADVILAVRCDLSETHPIIKSEVVMAVKRRKAKLVVINSRHIYLKKFASLDLILKPGTEVAFLNGLAHIINKEELINKEFIAARTEGFTSWAKTLEEYTPEKVASICGLSVLALKEAARLYARGPQSVILISTGQASTKHDRPLALAAANLALMTGQVGKENTGIFILNEKNNAQGALDMGVTPHLLPGYVSVDNAEERKRLEKIWGISIPETPGKGALPILQGALQGEIKGLYIVGENPLVNYPQAALTKKALEKVDFLVVQDCFLSETASLAQVVLPAATFAEKDGTFTNAERRVQRVRAALLPPGEAQTDLWIFRQLGKLSGVSLKPELAREIMEELRVAVPFYGGIAYGKLDAPLAPQWPCSDPDHEGTPVLYEKEFPSGRAKFQPADSSDGQSEGEYPFSLITGPVLYHSGSLSLRSPGLRQLWQESFLQIYPADAHQLGLTEGQEVLLKSKYGETKVKVTLSRKAAPQVLFLPYHFSSGGGNELIGWDLEIGRVKLEKV